MINYKMFLDIIRDYNYIERMAKEVLNLQEIEKYCQGCFFYFDGKKEKKQEKWAGKFINF